MAADPEIRTLSQSQAAPVAVAVPGKTDVPRDAVVLAIAAEHDVPWYQVQLQILVGLLGAVPVHLQATGCVYKL